MDLTSTLQGELTSTIAMLQVQANSSLTSQANRQSLAASGANLQNWYSQLLTGGLTTDQVQALQDDLDTARKDSLAANAAADRTKIIIGLVAGIVIAAGIIIYYRIKKKHAIS